MNASLSVDFAKCWFSYSWSDMNAEILVIKNWMARLMNKRRFSYSWPDMYNEILIVTNSWQDLWAKCGFSYSWSDLNTEILVLKILTASKFSKMWIFLFQVGLEYSKKCVWGWGVCVWEGGYQWDRNGMYRSKEYK